jgi:tetratricopeptide (TPR) repeat protein
VHDTARIAAFHSAVPQALADLSQLSDPWSVWARAVVLGAAARYSDALAEAERIPRGSDAHSMGVSLRASLLRQLGCHDLAQVADAEALAAALDHLARAEALTGAAADAVGLGDPDAADAHLDRARACLVGTDAWRQHVRLSWVRCEVALLRGRHRAAALAADEAVVRAERAEAQRHLAKGLLFRGVCSAELGRVGPALADLGESVRICDSMGFAAVGWPGHAVLARLVQERDPRVAQGHALQSCRTVTAVRRQLHGEVAARWGAREDLRVLCHDAGEQEGWDGAGTTD